MSHPCLCRVPCKKLQLIRPLSIQVHLASRPDQTAEAAVLEEGGDEPATPSSVGSSGSAQEESDLEEYVPWTWERGGVPIEDSTNLGDSWYDNCEWLDEYAPTKKVPFVIPGFHY